MTYSIEKVVEIRIMGFERRRGSGSTMADSRRKPKKEFASLLGCDPGQGDVQSLLATQ